MAVCYFNKKYDKKYSCKYEIKEDGIEVVVDYNIIDEIPINDGVRAFGESTEFEKRDILIIDYQSKMNYLLKNAEFCNYSESIGTPDGGYKTTFFSSFYFYDKNLKKICNIINDKNIKKIKIYSRTINDFMENPTFYKEQNNGEYIIKLKRNNMNKVVKINENNIDSLILSEEWTNERNVKNTQINIELKGYIEIDLKEFIRYEDVYDYMYELIIYFQLLKPNKFIVDQILVGMNNNYYGIFIPIEKVDYRRNYIPSSVKDDISEFLAKCYTTMSYRNSESEIRNIPYIILETSRNLEDNFLMFYRFIECYYKQQKIKNIGKTFIEYSIKNNYNNINTIRGPIENLVFEIIALRNHYVHKGYYIKDEELYVSFPKIGKKANPKNYRADNVNFDWIYERTNILYKIVIDIIFKNMLQYDNYEFNKPF